MPITNPSNSLIFVFGSNLAGRHGKGAALYAFKHKGAQLGEGEGHFGNSYALPTKNYHLKVLPLDAIAEHVKDFLAYARGNPDMKFFVTRVGCGLPGNSGPFSGYKDEDIAPLFTGYPSNVDLPAFWPDIIAKTHEPLLF